MLEVLSDLVLLVFPLLLVVLLWRGERVRVLVAAVLIVAAWLASEGLKILVREDRPCRGLEGCPEAGDFSFPSNHAMVAGTAAVAIMIMSRTLGWIAMVAAALAAASRLALGVHFVHDVVAGLVLGALIGATLLLVKAASRAGAPKAVLPSLR